ncbi:MAG: LCP family protein [Prochloraceae cyanobacterium]
MYEKDYSKKERKNAVPKNGMKIKGSIILLGLGFSALAMVSAGIGALLAISLASKPLQKEPLTPEQERVFPTEKTVAKDVLQIPKLSRPVNILILGTKVLTSDLKDRSQVDRDLGYHALVNSFEGLSDTILLLRFDPDRQKLSLLSIPRDTKVYVEGRGINKINFANYAGGPSLAAKTVSQLLGGGSVDRYVRVNVQGIEKLIDALGGVTVYVPKDMKYVDHSQHLYIDLKQGMQHLDGAKAVQFLRFRHDRLGDIGRVQRQQILMRAAIEQALKPSTVVKIPKIFSIVKENIDTNLSGEELLALAGFAAKTNRANLQMLMLPGQYNGNGRNQISYWLPNYKAIHSLSGDYFGVDRSENKEIESAYRRIDRAYVRVAIQDSTGDPEAVQSLIANLQRAGYQRIFVGNSWSQPLNTTQILAQNGDERSAVMLRMDLGLGEVLVQSTGVLSSNVTIQLGRDWQKLQESLDPGANTNSY